MCSYISDTFDSCLDQVREGKCVCRNHCLDSPGTIIPLLTEFPRPIGQCMLLSTLIPKLKRNQRGVLN